MCDIFKLIFEQEKSTFLRCILYLSFEEIILFLLFLFFLLFSLPIFFSFCLWEKLKINIYEKSIYKINRVEIFLYCDSYSLSIFNCVCFFFTVNVSVSIWLFSSSSRLYIYLNTYIYIFRRKYHLDDFTFENDMNNSKFAQSHRLCYE